LATTELDAYHAALAPDCEFVDHRTIGFPVARGADQVMRGIVDLATNVATRVDDILRLETGALLVPRADLGTHRASGDAHETRLLLLYTFGADGRATRNEDFGADDGDAALARFDELVGTSPARTAAAAESRANARVRRNAATANAARLDAAIAAREAGPL